MIDATRIGDNIHQGSATTPELAAAAGFTMLVLCAQEHQPVAHPGCSIKVVHCPMDDAVLTAEEWKRAVRAAREVASHMMRGGRALVTCFAGRNRSGLVTALALNIATGAPYPGIIKHIRNRREGALTNRSFVEALLASGKEQAARKEAAP